MTLTVKPISSAEHLAFVNSLPSASFLQTPAWGLVKSEWRPESIGWFDDDRLIGAALLLMRKLPKVSKWFAYIPEGPLLDWNASTTENELALSALVEYAKNKGVFLLRIGPLVVKSSWRADTLKSALAGQNATSLAKLPPDAVNAAGTELGNLLEKSGWRPPQSEDGFGLGQPQFVYQLALAGKTPDALLAGFNQLWRRNLKRADKEGVSVSTGTRQDLAAFHQIYLETAKRDHFTPRPLGYFEQMWDAMRDEDASRINLYLATWQGRLIAATIMMRVGDHAWYSYGASTTFGREARGSNAIQWQMMQDALASGCTVYDLRGITPTLDPNDAHVGLIQFKLGTGGEAVEYVGEWDYRISNFWSLLFTFLLRIRK